MPLPKSDMKNSMNNALPTEGVLKVTTGPMTNNYKNSNSSYANFKNAARNEVENTNLKKDKITGSGPKVRIGIISGSGPDAGVNMLQNILNVNRERLGSRYKSDIDWPWITLMQVPRIGGPHGRWDLPNDGGDFDWNRHELLLEEMFHTIANIYPLVDCFCLCCNTLHTQDMSMRQFMTAHGMNEQKFVSIIYATRDYILNHPRNTQKLGGQVWVHVLGTMVVTDQDGSPYKPLWDTLNWPTLSVPLRESLQALIIKTKANGWGQTEKDEFWQIVLQIVKRPNGSNMNKNDDYNGSNMVSNFLVFACTEFPLLLDDAKRKILNYEYNTIVVDPTFALTQTLLNFQPQQLYWVDDINRRRVI